jgi:lipid A disaccharide synthetase
MAPEIWMLEQAWLKAETVADKSRTATMRATARLDDTREKVAVGAAQRVPEIKVLLNTVETTVQTLKARQEAAEQQAAEMYARFEAAARSHGEIHA